MEMYEHQNIFQVCGSYKAGGKGISVHEIRKCLKLCYSRIAEIDRLFFL